MKQFGWPLSFMSRPHGTPFVCASKSWLCAAVVSCSCSKETCLRQNFCTDNTLSTSKHYRRQQQLAAGLIQALHCPTKQAAISSGSAYLASGKVAPCLLIVSDHKATSASQHGKVDGAAVVPDHDAHAHTLSSSLLQQLP